MTTFYAMYYTGQAGSGFAVFAMKDGTIAGADAIGGELDGTYSQRDDGSYDVSVKLTVPAGAALVTGTLAGQQPHTQLIEAHLPANLGAGAPVGVQTPTGPVNVIFRHLRTIE
jgi:hypothetical protein